MHWPEEVYVLQTFCLTYTGGFMCQTVLYCMWNSVNVSTNHRTRPCTHTYRCQGSYWDQFHNQSMFLIQTKLYDEMPRCFMCPGRPSPWQQKPLSIIVFWGFQTAWQSKSVRKCTWSFHEGKHLFFAWGQMTHTWKWFLVPLQLWYRTAPIKVRFSLTSNSHLRLKASYCLYGFITIWSLTV